MKLVSKTVKNTEIAGKKEIIEILAPAGSFEALRAAVNAGADAVYLGGQAFNARRNAKNFGGEELSRAIGLCHGRGVKVYLTLNTLVYDDELDSLKTELSRAGELRIDAIIAQDLAVAALAKEICPQVALHASTQMSVHSPDGAAAVKKLGFSRVVLAREMSFEEIALIEGIETEVFVHGALCASVSGQCYYSAVLGGRSGNRGLCAQPCRLPDRGGVYRLSLKDLSLYGEMGRLKSLGISALKIEGRMKSPEYVAAAVRACKSALAGKPYDGEKLRQVFSRGGFTSGYFNNAINGSMFGVREK